VHHALVYSDRDAILLACQRRLWCLCPAAACNTCDPPTGCPCIGCGAGTPACMCTAYRMLGKPSYGPRLAAWAPAAAYTTFAPSPGCPFIGCGAGTTAGYTLRILRAIYDVHPGMGQTGQSLYEPCTLYLHSWPLLQPELRTHGTHSDVMPAGQMQRWLCAAVLWWHKGVSVQSCEDASAREDCDAWACASAMLASHFIVRMDQDTSYSTASAMHVQT